jgi:hypothetical protein
MSKPLFVSIPHRLGRDEAKRRLQSGLGNARTHFGHLFTVQEEIWSGENLAFRLTALGQAVSGSIDVLDDRVNMQIVLPWLLAKVAETIQPLIRREGMLMLEKK